MTLMVLSNVEDSRWPYVRNSKKSHMRGKHPEQDRTVSDESFQQNWGRKELIETWASKKAPEMWFAMSMVKNCQIVQTDEWKELWMGDNFWVFFTREKYLSEMQNKVEHKNKNLKKMRYRRNCKKGCLQPSSYCVFQTKGIRVGYRSSG